MPPEELQGSRWVEALGGVCLFPSAATGANAAASAGRVIDYFVVSQSLSHRACVSIVPDAGTAPHCPVLLQLSAFPQCGLEFRAARVPRRFPLEVPVSCRRADPQPRWQHCCKQMSSLPLAEKWQLWVANAELDLADVHDLAPAENPECYGRAFPPQFVTRRPLLPRPLAFPALSPAALWWRLLARCFEGLARRQPPNLRVSTCKLGRARLGTELVMFRLKKPSPGYCCSSCPCRC
eukprot:9217725-Pyramimonas_sp.AAC.1